MSEITWAQRAALLAVQHRQEHPGDLAAVERPDRQQVEHAPEQVDLE